ncbi:endonuclease-reverse transcriptase [Plakobranchus ocellatus]|uniref:Endonuclease-reverse transcriptase n=1 Tax=Plakobranchus ocellatus TaxID=259542 RepID=A0AAV4A403_9GAST|nr:endonuclease-reverse transcriptase [Plakobranchus ocellatus]
MTQIIPMSLLVRRYVTFPSLPMNADVIDHFTVVASHADTVITVQTLDPVPGSQTVTLSGPGDSSDLQLPAKAFYLVEGTKQFYLYAKFSTSDVNGLGAALCTLSLLPWRLHKQSYRFSMTEPLRAMDSVYVAVIARTIDMVNINLTAVGGASSVSSEMCEAVQANNPYKLSTTISIVSPGSSMSGCYFKLNNTAGTVYTLRTQSSSSLKFAAYMFARGARSLACFPLGADLSDPIDMQIQNKLEATEMWFLRRMLRIPWTAKKTNERVLKEANKRRSLVRTIRKRQATFLGHVMRRGKLEHLVTTGKFEGKKSR